MQGVLAFAPNVQVLPRPATSFTPNSNKKGTCMPSHIPAHIPITRTERATRRKQVRLALGFGFLSPKRGELSSNTGNLLPSPDANCACASDKPYGKCCRRYHTAQSVPSEAEQLLRSRYSAYAYRLPSYIMKTTHSSAIELDRRQWKREIMDFCRDYRFVGGVDIVEVQNPGPTTTRILFRYGITYFSISPSHWVNFFLDFLISNTTVTDDSFIFINPQRSVSLTIVRISCKAIHPFPLWSWQLLFQRVIFGTTRAVSWLTLINQDRCVREPTDLFLFFF